MAWLCENGALKGVRACPASTNCGPGRLARYLLTGFTEDKRAREQGVHR